VLRIALSAIHWVLQMRWLIEGVMLNGWLSVQWLRRCKSGLAGVRTQRATVPWALALCGVASSLVLAACGGGNSGADASAAVPSSAIDAVVAAQEESDQRHAVMNAADCNWSQGETSSPETFSGCQATAMNVLANARASSPGLLPQDTSQVIDPEGTLATSAMLAQAPAPAVQPIAVGADVSQPAPADTTTRPEAVAMVSVVDVPKGEAKALISLKDL